MHVSTTSAPASFKWLTIAGQLGKNIGGSGPFGPWIVTADEIPDPGQLQIQTRVNGNIVQDGLRQALSFQERKSQPMLQGQ